MYKKYLKTVGLLVIVALTVGSCLTGCSRDPNVRKQKYFESGKRYVEKGKYREAAIQFSNALRIDSNFGDAHYQLALVNLKLENAQNAYIELSRTVALQPDNVQVRIDLGNLLLIAGQPDKAQEQADAVLAKDPNNVNAHVLKSNVEASRHQLDSALSEMNKALQLDPGRSNSYLSLGVLEIAKTSDSPEAEANFKKAIELDPKSAPARLQLATFYDHNKRFDEAEQQLQEALKTLPKDQAIRWALVRHYLLQERKDSAEQSAKEAKAALAPDPNGSQFLGRYYMAIGDPKSATSEYSQLANQFPKERAMQTAYLELLMMAGDKDGAIKQANSILKRYSQDEQALTAKGILLLEQGKTGEGRDVLQSVIQANPNNAIAHYQLGNALNELNQKGQAEAQWRESAKIQPGYLPAENALAGVALKKRDASSLARIAQTTIEKVPGAPDGYLMQAQVDAFNNEPADAEKQLEKAIQIAPRSTLAYVQLGRLRMALKRLPDAEKVLDQALQIDPQDGPAMGALMQVYLDEKQPAKAMKRAQEMVEKFPNYANGHLVLGELAASQKDLPLAENELVRAAQIAPGTSAVYYQLAMVQLARHEVLQAQATFQTAIEKNPKDPNAYWMLGTVCEQLKDTKNAEANYRKALQLQPDLGVAANNLAYLMLVNGENIDQVISYAETARRQMPESPAVADTLGWAYYQKGTSGLAVELLRDAVKGLPNSATYHYHLGMAYSKSGDRPNAKIELQKAMQLEGEQAKKDEIRKSLASLS